MQHKSLPHFSVNDFFERYARAVEQQDTKYLASCYALPCTFMADDASQVYTTSTKLEGLINQGKRFYALHGIVQVEPDVRNKLSITDNIIRVKMNWQYTDKKGKEVYNCDYFYIMRLHEQEHWKIEVAISINEKEAIDRLNKKAT